MKYYTFYMPDNDHTYELLLAHAPRDFDVFIYNLNSTTNFVMEEDKQKLLKISFSSIQKEALEQLKYYETNPENLLTLKFDTDIAPFASEVTLWFLAGHAQNANSPAAEFMQQQFSHYIEKGGNIEVIRRYLVEQEASISKSKLSNKKRLLKEIKYYQGMLERETPYDKVFEIAEHANSETGQARLEAVMNEFDARLLQEVVSDKIACFDATIDENDKNHPYYKGMKVVKSLSVLQESSESE